MDDGKWTKAARKRKKYLADLLAEKDRKISEKESEIAEKMKQISDLKVKK